MIDFHTHFFPQKMQEAIYQWFEKYGWGIFKKYTLPEAADSLRNFYEQWVVAIYAHKKGISEDLNRWLYDVSRKYSEIIPFGTVHPDDNVEKVIKIALDSYRFPGIKFHTHIARTAPEDERLFPLYEEIIKHGAILLLHGSIHPTDAGFVSDFDPYEVSGVKHIEKLMEMFPDMKVVVAHLGMGEYDEFGKLLEKFDNLYLDTTMTHCMDRVRVKHPQTPPPPRDKFMEKYSDKILFGSDFPFIPYPLSEQINCISNLKITDEAKEKILYRNAKELLNTTNHL